MAITRWEPFGVFTTLERDMQDLIDRLGVRPVTTGWRPATDVYRENGTLMVRTELPGIDPDTELEIDVENNVLHITGEKKTDREVKDENRYLRERRFGTFRRDVLLPEGVDAEAITATYDQGILTVSVPLPVESEVSTDKVTVKVTPTM